MLSEDLFTLLVLLVAVQRSAELRLSRRNERELRRQGALEHAPGQVPPMQLLHGLWLACSLLEVRLLHPEPRPWLAVVAGLLFIIGQVLRYAARRALGARWSVRILTVPGAEPIAGGIFRYLRHPNYLGVMLEVAALPLVHSALRTALVFSIINAIWLAWRIAAEERALSANGGYREALADRPRLWPRFRVRGSV